MFVDEGYMKVAETPVDEVGQVLLDAADKIEKYGWAQGRYGSPTHGFCAYGAMMAVCNSRNIIAASFRLIDRLNGCEIGLWNDRLAASKEHVIATLRAAARS
jgi:hypothetical protein